MALTKEQRLAMTREQFKRVFRCECVLSDVQIDAVDGIVRKQTKGAPKADKYLARYQSLMTMQAHVLLTHDDGDAA